MPAPNREEVSLSDLIFSSALLWLKLCYWLLAEGAGSKGKGESSVNKYVGPL